MDTQLRKGLLEAYILTLLLKGDYYGYQLLTQIKEQMVIAESTLYPLLKRLEQQEMLQTYQETVSGRLRKYYAITAHGRMRQQAYQAMCQEVKAIISIIEQGGQDE